MSETQEVDEGDQVTHLGVVLTVNYTYLDEGSEETVVVATSEDGRTYTLALDTLTKVPK